MIIPEILLELQKIFLFIIFCTIIYLIIKVRSISKNIKNDNIVKHNILKDYIVNFEKYKDALEHFLNLSYFTLYQSDISVYVGSQIGIDEKENRQLCEKFIDILYSLMGKNLLDEYFMLFGSEESFLNYCILFFNNELVNKDLKYMEEELINNENLEENEG